jgi:hypothetical protein
MRTVEKSIAAGDALSLKADCFVGAARSNIVGKHAKPNPKSFSVGENALNQERQERPAVAQTGATDRNSLDMSHPFGRAPFAHDGKSDGFRFATGDKISVTAVGKSRPMLRGIPPSDQLLVAGKPLGRHDEVNVTGCPSVKLHTSAPLSANQLRLTPIAG